MRSQTLALKSTHTLVIYMPLALKGIHTHVIYMPLALKGTHKHLAYIDVYSYTQIRTKINLVKDKRQVCLLPHPFIMVAFALYKIFPNLFVSVSLKKITPLHTYALFLESLSYCVDLFPCVYASARLITPIL